MFRAHLGLNLPVHVPLNFQQHVTQDNEVEISPNKIGPVWMSWDKMVYNWGRWVDRKGTFASPVAGCFLL